jgi:hypothetical protein
VISRCRSISPVFRFSVALDGHELLIGVIITYLYNPTTYVFQSLGPTESRRRSMIYSWVVRTVMIGE